MVVRFYPGSYFLYFYIYVFCVILYVYYYFNLFIILYMNFFLLYFLFFFQKSLNNLVLGALTSKYYAYKSRMWELETIEVLDFFDPFLNFIRVDLRGTKILRILPRLVLDNDSKLSLPWISNKSRFFFDGLLNQRVEFCFSRDLNKNLFNKIKWHDSLVLLEKNLFKNYIYSNSFFKIFFGGLKSLEDSLVLKDFLNLIGFRFLVNFDIGSFFNLDYRYFYLNNLNFFSNSNCIVLLGLNPRLESVYLNLKFKSLLKKNNKIKILSFGFINSLYNSNYIFISNNFVNLLKLFEGRNFFSLVLSNSINPVILFGNSFFKFVNHKNLIFIFEYFYKYYENIQKNRLNWFNVIHNNSSFINILESGVFNNMSNIVNMSFFSKQNLKLVFICGFEFLKLRSNLLKFADFVVFFNHHFDFISQWSDLILPLKSVYELDCNFINTFGENLKNYPLSLGFNFSKQLWKIFKILLDNVYSLNYLDSSLVLKLRYNKLFNHKNALFFNFKIKFFIRDTTLLNSYCLIKNYYSMDLISQSSNYFRLNI